MCSTGKITIFCLLQQNLPQSVIENVGGKIFTFGSYRLGVHTKGKYCLYCFNYLEKEYCFNFLKIIMTHPSQLLAVYYTDQVCMEEVTSGSLNLVKEERYKMIPFIPVPSNAVLSKIKNSVSQ